MSEPESGQAGRLPIDQTSADEGVARSGSNEVSGVSGTGSPPDAEETASLLKQLTVGAIVDGKYRIDEIIGRGAMGVVAAATHVHLKERVALKFLSTRAHAQSQDFHSRFRREAQVSAKLRNEHITRVIDVGVWKDRVPFMVMDHLVGHDLRQTLKASPNGRLPTATALDYIVQVCEGLAEAHAIGIVHRDLKPSNLFVTKRPDGTELIKILDFGISKWSTHEEAVDELTQTGVVLGSPKYMSPEQLFGSASVDMRADVWSIGAIFYEMLTSRPPFDFPTLTRICAELAADRPPPPLKQFIPDVPDALEGVLMRCFVRDRDNRMPNVAEFAGALLEAVDVPFAGQVRQKIGAMLDAKAYGSQLGTSSGGMPLGTGNYRSLSMSGATPSISSSGALRVGDFVPPSAATAGGVEAVVATEEKGGKKKTVLIALLLGAVVGIGVLYMAFSGGKPPEAKGPPPPTSTIAAAAQVPTTAPAASAPVSATPPVATAAPPSTAPAEAPNSGAAAAAPAPQPRHGGGGGGGGRHTSPRSSPTPPPTPAPAPAPVAAPAPAPAPQPTTKANPLEDRQ